MIAAGAVLARYASLRSNDQQLEQAQNQLRLLETQIKQGQDERAVLDDQLPRGGGPMVARLAAAEKELAELEEPCAAWIRGTRPRGKMPTRRPDELTRPTKSFAPRGGHGARGWKRPACR